MAYIQAKLPDKGYDVNGVMDDLVSYKRRPEDLSDKIAPTFGAIIEIPGKAYPTLFRTISLLKLSPEIQAAISAGTLLSEIHKPSTSTKAHDSNP